MSINTPVKVSQQVVVPLVCLKSVDLWNRKVRAGAARGCEHRSADQEHETFEELLLFLLEHQSCSPHWPLRSSGWCQCTRHGNAVHDFSEDVLKSSNETLYYFLIRSDVKWWKWETNRGFWVVIFWLDVNHGLCELGQSHFQMPLTSFLHTSSKHSDTWEQTQSEPPTPQVEHQQNLQ